MPHRQETREMTHEQESGKSARGGKTHEQEREESAREGKSREQENGKTSEAMADSHEFP